MKIPRTWLLLAGLSAGAFASRGAAQQAVALTATGSLVTFNAASPGTTSVAVAVTGLAGGESLVGIDYRPVNRTLVGLTNQSRLVTLNAATGAATALATLSVPLAGTTFGVDFNPLADRLRVVSNTGQSLRINVDTGAVIVDGSLAYATTDVNTGATPQVSGAGYTNSVGGRLATTTILYNIDFAKDILVRQDPPNNGTLVTVGALGADFNEMTGFDIFSPATAYATRNASGASTLHRVNLATGAATLVGAFPAALSIVDLSLVVKEPALGVTANSTRGLVGPGEGALISGFVVEGTSPVTVLINARGPSLTQFGVANVVADPRISLYSGQTLLESNDDWQTHARAAEITASGLAPGNAKEAALYVTLAPGAYTAVMTTGGTATAVAITEVFEMP